MAIPRSPESDLSLISLDPAIARAIRPYDPTLEPSRPALASTATEPVISVREVPSQAVGGEEREKQKSKLRPPSLKRAKNSNEVLRQRSTRARQDPNPSQSAPANTQGRNFTVAKVGSGGKLYLRPSANSTPLNFSTPLQSAPPVPESAFWDQLEQEREDSEQSSPRRYPVSEHAGIARPHTSKTAGRKYGPPPSASHSRSFSASTRRETEQLSSSIQDGVFRVVIDRTASGRPKTADAKLTPNLDVSIPHHRLGRPRFDEEGAAGMHTSIYTQKSEPMPEKLHSVLGIDPKSQIPSGRLISPWSQPTLPYQTGGPSVRRETVLRMAESHYKSPDFDHKRAVTPQVFDDLATFEDDASVVRFSRKTGAITAATPARIVAQISSEEFMDYELVSDFFLTFRAYMSTQHLLSLLLARLHWAINRLEEDGRIIRIRTFAALRHWILNYFVDDFLVDRGLRVQFCTEINQMYQEVSKRSGGGVSDMKIVFDLKRCWNGRCQLYWDSSEQSTDTRPEADILPGGVLGSRDPSLDNLNLIIDKKSNAFPKNLRERANLAKIWYGKMEKSGQHPRRLTVGDPKKQALSSYPPVGEAPPRTSHGHKRSGSTSDSIRDGLEADPPMYVIDPHAGSLIRGNVFPPSAPFVDVVAPGPPAGHRRRPSFNALGIAGLTGNLKAASSNPKTLMGSIRRALSTRQTIIPAKISHEEMPAVPSSQGRATTLGLSTTKSTDTLRERKGSPNARHHLRIDLLCAAASQSYLMTQTKLPTSSTTTQGLGVSVPKPGPDVVSLRSLGSRDFSLEAGDMQALMGPNGTDFADRRIPDQGAEEYEQDGPGMAVTSDFTGAGMVSMPHLAEEKIANERRQNLTSSRRSSSVDSSLTRRVNGRIRPSVQHSRHMSVASGTANILLRATQRRASEATLTDETGKNEKLGPTQPLRRRPGGNLRAIENVNDLTAAPRQQPNESQGADQTSMGSLGSLGSMGSILMMVEKRATVKRENSPETKPISLIRTDSVKQLRPSFEAAISKFSAIPDDDDGGLEATLLKLEGKYEKTPVQVSKPNEAGFQGSAQLSMDNLQQRHHSRDASLLTFSDRSSSIGLTESSYNSLPLLERGLVDESMQRQTTPTGASSSTLEQMASQKNEVGLRNSDWTDPAEYDIPEQEANAGSLSPTLLRPRPSTTEGSFLLDEDDDFTDLSSEMSVEVRNSAAGQASDMPSHALAHPPSPAFSFHHATTPPVDPMQYQQRPLTPQPSPIQAEPGPSIQMTMLGGKPVVKSTSSAGHIPFILACESEVLAQQLTLVEKAALSEVDWTDLVDMKWDHSSPAHLNWVDYLAAEEHRGIDLVVTRFNLVVKWVLSEIVMTQDILERARAITKFIHIAAHAKNMHNYTTMLQITIALTSTQCARLKGTWDLISEEEKALLRKMEVLIQPIRNFHDLRVEMETANLQAGCIPFLGLYIHDLTFNAQKPSQIAGPHRDEPLINFEKYRTTATIVKSLLRLIDASSQYEFTPVVGIIEPCLWLAALSDEKIADLSNSLD